MFVGASGYEICATDAVTSTGSVADSFASHTSSPSAGQLRTWKPRPSVDVTLIATGGAPLVVRVGPREA